MPVKNPAVQAVGDSSNNIAEKSLVGVVPLSLGIEISCGVMSKFIERNTKIPFRASKTYATFKSTEVIRVFEGERVFTKDNHQLGILCVSGITPPSKGTPQIRFTFDIDVNGILQVKVEDIKGGSSHSITIKNGKGRLTKNEVNRMLREAKETEREDQIQRERIEARNVFKCYVNFVMSEASKSNKLFASNKEKAKNMCQNYISWINSNMIACKDEINQKLEEVQREFLPIISKMY